MFARNHHRSRHGATVGQDVRRLAGFVGILAVIALAAWALALAAPAQTASFAPRGLDPLAAQRIAAAPQVIDLQALVDRQDRVVLRAGTYILTRHVRIARPNVVIECPDGVARIISQAAGEQRETPLIDATGGYRLQLRNLWLSTYGDRETPPVGAGLLLARDERLSPMLAYLENVSIRGKWRVAALVNIAGEASTFVHCDFNNQWPGGHAVLFAGRKPERMIVRSNPVPQTTLQNAFVSCAFGVMAPFQERNDGAACIAVEGQHGDAIGDIVLHGGGWSAKQPGSYGMLLSPRGDSGHIRGIWLYGIRAEIDHGAAVMHIDQPDRQQVSDILWQGGSAVFTDTLLSVESTRAVSRIRIENVALSGGRPTSPIIRIPHAQHCAFDLAGFNHPDPVLIPGHNLNNQVRR